MTNKIQGKINKWVNRIEIVKYIFGVDEPVS